MDDTMLVKLGFVLAGALFLFAAIKPSFTGSSVNVTFLVIGVACGLIGFAVGRKHRGPPSAGA